MGTLSRGRLAASGAADRTSNTGVCCHGSGVIHAFRPREYGKGARRLLFAAIVAGVASFAISLPTPAATLMLTGTPGDWVVDFDANVVSLFWDTATTTNNTQGTLNEITNRQNNGKIILTFRQTTASVADSAASGGLRVNFQKDDSNIVGPDWASYQLKLIDVIPGKNVAFVDHPPQPHFHPTTNIATTAATFIVGQKTFNGDNLNMYQSTFLGQADGMKRDFPDTIDFNDVIKKGEKLGIRNLLLHERLFLDAQNPNAPMNRREFRLEESVTPVPEPNSLCGLGTGLAMVAWCARRRMRRAGHDAADPT